MFHNSRIAVSLLALAFVAGCQQQAGSVGGKRIVQFATTKADMFGVPAEYRALQMGLEKSLDGPVAFSAQPNGSAIGIQLEQGNIPFAILTASEYAEIEDPSKLTLIASGVNELGKTSHRGHIVVKAKSHLKTIADCAGKRFAFGKHKDLLSDYGARDALSKAGVPMDKILPELVPTTVALPIEGRLYCGDAVPGLVVWDITINAGVIDEIAFNKLPPTGGNPITGVSRDQFEIVGETAEVPEMVVAAGPGADAQMIEKVKNFLLNQAKEDDALCKQLGIKGFAAADRAMYDSARTIIPHT